MFQYFYPPPPEFCVFAHGGPRSVWSGTVFIDFNPPPAGLTTAHKQASEYIIYELFIIMFIIQNNDVVANKKTAALLT